MSRSNPTPPAFARRIFNWWSSKADVEDLLGDIDEYYFENLETKGKFIASIKYYQHVFSLLFSYTLVKRKRDSQFSPYYGSNSSGMLLNYVKIAVRSFSKYRLFTSINILGLAMGMSICLLALSISVAIYKSDDYHTKKDRIYQLNTYIVTPEEDKTFGSTFYAMGDYMASQYPFIEEVLKVRSGFQPEIKHQGSLFDFHGYYAGDSFFELFDFKFIQGNPKTALEKPNSIVLTKSVAELLFRDKDPIGQLLDGQGVTYEVTGVMEDLKQTHLYFEVLTSYASIENNSTVASDWVNYRNNYVYLLLNPGTTKETLDEALTEVSQHAMTFNLDETMIELESVQLDQVVPRWNISNAIGIGWDQPSMIFFMLIGMLILLPAVFNYTNLSIARALKRAKEIGVRKVVGAENGQIKSQFVIETIILSLLALGGSILIFIPLRNEFLEMVIAAEVLNVSLGIDLILVFVSFSLLVGVLAGIFPALYFSRMNPVQTLKGTLTNRSASVSGIKKGLFVFQFFLSLVFIIGVATIARQYAYVFNHQHGFESDNVLVVPYNGMDRNIAMNEIQKHPDVKKTTSSSHLPGVFLSSAATLTSNEVDTIMVGQAFIGKDFIDNMGIDLTWGEHQSISQSNQSEEFVLVNEKFLDATSVFNIQKDSLRFTLEDGTNCRIVGIMTDFNFEPLAERIAPLLFRYDPEQTNYMLLTVNSNNIKKTLEELEVIWQDIDQQANLDASFLDDEIEDSYYFLMAQIKIFSYLSAFAIIISCLGLLGMVAYTTENRIKEIAIRKIMGANNQRLYLLLSRDFIRLILVSAMLAVPFSYLFYDKLVLFFLMPEGSGMGFLEIIASVALLLIMAFITVFWQTSKVTNINPAVNLRNE